jgi:hypothetical protein
VASDPAAGDPAGGEPTAALSGVTPAVNAGGCAGTTVASGAGREGSHCGGRGGAIAAAPGATLLVSAGTGAARNWRPRRWTPAGFLRRPPRRPGRPRRADCSQPWDRWAPGRSFRGLLLRCLLDRPIQPSLVSILYLDAVDVYLPWFPSPYTR